MEQPMVKPDNNMVWAILCTLCCCLPLGIYSIVLASKVNNLWAMGQYQLAQQNANDAKKWALIGAAIGLVVNGLYFVIMFIGALAGM